MLRLFKVMSIKNYRDIFEKKWNDNRGRCEVCGVPLSGKQPQLAHRIAKKKMWIAKYGAEVIDHEMNLALVCGLQCNSAVLIDMKDLPREELAEKIKTEINK